MRKQLKDTSSTIRPVDIAPGSREEMSRAQRALDGLDTFFGAPSAIGLNPVLQNLITRNMTAIAPTYPGDYLLSNFSDLV